MTATIVVLLLMVVLRLFPYIVSGAHCVRRGPGQDAGGVGHRADGNGVVVVATDSGGGG